MFVERLAFDGIPAEFPVRRLMVQARQIATYCRAALMDLYQPPFALDACLDNMIRLFRSPDGVPGYVFSVSRSGTVVDSTRDLYAHAFVLFAFAWTYKLTLSPHILKMADEVLDVLDGHFMQADGTLANAVPSRDKLRRQNPHMHLLEAYLALAEASGAERYLARASLLVEWALDLFLEPRTGLLIEEFNADWSLLRPHGQNRVEPGHLCEWAWLLREHERLSDRDHSAIIDRFLIHATASGCHQSNGLLFDAVTETGDVLEGNYRCWPHTEAIKALYAEALRGKPASGQAAERYVDRLFKNFVLSDLRGGWVDRIDREFRPLVDHMPASSLYHIMGAIFLRASAKTFLAR